MLYSLEEYPENYGQFTQMYVDRFLTWQIGLWEESRRSVPIKFASVYEEHREKILKLRCLNIRINRGKRICLICRIKDLECFIKNRRSSKQPVSDSLCVPEVKDTHGQWMYA